MTNTQASTLVFKNEAGDYFLVPQETLTRGRVPEEHKAEVERLLIDTDGDVSGYLVSTTYTLFRAINMGAKALGELTADAALARWIEQEIYSGGHT